MNKKKFKFTELLSKIGGILVVVVVVLMLFIDFKNVFLNNNKEHNKVEVVEVGKKKVVDDKNPTSKIKELKEEIDDEIDKITKESKKNSLIWTIVIVISIICILVIIYYIIKLAKQKNQP